MATVAPALGTLVESEIKNRLSSVAEVSEIHVLPTDHYLSIWVGLRGDDLDVRYRIYDIESEISEKFSSIVLDLHVVEVPDGKALGNIISETKKIYARQTA